MSPTTLRCEQGNLFSALQSSGLNVLFSVVPCTTGITSEDSQHNSRGSRTNQNSPTNEGPKRKPQATGTAMASIDGNFISFSAP